MKRAMASLLTVGSVLAGSFAATTVATAATGDYIDVVTTEADARTGRLFHLFVIDVDVRYECQPTGADTSGVIEFPVHAHTRTGIEAVCDGTDRTATLPNVAVYSNQSTVEVKLSSPQGLAAAVVAQDTAVIFVTGPSNTPITPPTSSPTTSIATSTPTASTSTTTTTTTVSPKPSTTTTTVTVGPPPPAPVVVATSAPRALRAVKRATSVRLTWAPPRTLAAALQNYRVTGPGFGRNVTSRSMVLTGLRTNMVYTFYVQARTTKGLGPKAKVTFRTYPAPRAYPNCGAMNRVYPHGVGMAGAVDKTTGTRVRNYLVDARTYRLNDGRVRPNQYDLDRDNDRIACERR